MSLNLFDNLSNKTKDGNLISDFVNELKEFLNKGDNMNKSVKEESSDNSKITYVTQNRINKEKIKIMKSYKNGEIASEEDLNHVLSEMEKQEIERQNKNLAEYRKEGHLYVVTEKWNDQVYLWDLTDTPDKEIQEIEISDELFKKIDTWSVLLYKDGEYSFYSNDGYKLEQEALARKETQK